MKERLDDPGAGLDLDSIMEQVDAAQDMVRRLCLRRDDPEKREWIMSIPARPSHDPDLVIGAALNAIPALVAEVERLRAAPAVVATPELLEAVELVGRFIGKVCPDEDNYVWDALEKVESAFRRAALASQRSEEKR